MSKKIVVSYSGGKDSTATLVKALKEYPKEDVIPVFADTGWEHPLLYEYLDYVEKKLDIEIVRVKSDKFKDVLDVIRKKRMFPSVRRRFCTDKLKREPLLKFLVELVDKGYEVEKWVGIRKDESQGRAERYGHIKSTDVFEAQDVFPTYPKKLRKIKIRFPVIDLSSNEVFKLITEAGLELNPLYHKGFNRVGCFPCVISSLANYKQTWRDEVGRERILQLIELEKELRNKGIDTTILMDKSGEELLKILEKQDAQGSLFDDDDMTMCGFCHF